MIKSTRGDLLRILRALLFVLALPFLLNGIADALQSGIIDTYVGGGNGDGDAAINAAIDPRGLALSGPANAPDLYIADGKNNRVRRVDGDSGVIETVAGDGVYGYDGDGGEAQNASLRFPLDVAVDAAGNVYIADTFNNRIRKVGTNRRIVTIAGNGAMAYSGEGLAAQESLSNPYGVTVGPDGNLYIADLGNNRVRKVSPPGCSPSTCVISTVAGSGASGYGGDGGQALNAAITNPADVAFDAAGSMYIADRGNDRIRRVTPNGIITTVAGGALLGPGGSIGDGGPGSRAVFDNPSQLAIDASGNVYISDTNHHRIRLLQAGTFNVSTIAGTGATGWTGDGGAATAATLFNTWGVAVTAPGTFWLSQSAETAVSPNNRVRKVVSFGVIRSVVGGGDGDGGAAINAQVDPRGGEAVNGAGALPDLYFADGDYNMVRRVDGATGIIHTIAGTGVAGYSGDGGTAVNATLRTPFDAAVAPGGVVYVADTFNNVIRKIAAGTITTAAGNGQAGSNGDGAALQRSLNAPRGIDVDRFGNLFIADSENNRIRKVSNGQMVTVAGDGSWGYSGDDGPALRAQLRTPADVAVADDGTLYIADSDSQRIRRVSPSGIITTFAGNGGQGFSGDGGLATLARLSNPSYVSLDAGGNLFIADSSNKRVRRVAAAGGAIETVAGNGQSTASGDGGAATAAGLGTPSGVAVAPSGDPLFISSKDTDSVRIVGFAGSLPTPPATATPIPTAPSNVTVSGEVTYYANGQVRVPGVQVALVGVQTQYSVTNASGNYGAAVPTGNRTIEPAKTGDAGSAVSALDAVRVLQVISGEASFTPLQQLACDATGDGSLSVLDAVRILQLSAGEISRLPVGQTCGSDWLFYPRPDSAPNQSVTIPSISSGSCRRGSIALNPLLAPAAHQDFEAILLGDCTGNWDQSGAALRALAAAGGSVRLGALRRAPGRRARLPVYVHRSSFQALDITIGYDESALTLRSVRPHGNANGALISVGTDRANVVGVSLARLAPIDGSAGAILIVDFDRAGRGEDTSVRLLSAQVDEQTNR